MGYAVITCDRVSHILVIKLFWVHICVYISEGYMIQIEQHVYHSMMDCGSLVYTSSIMYVGIQMYYMSR